jgi:hypothetical protein
MNLNDYQTPAADPYAPDPRASQRVAAQHRAAAVAPGRPTHDTEPIVPLTRRTRYAVPFGIGALMLIMLMIGAASYQLASLPAAKPLQIETASAQAFANQPQEGPSAPTSATEAPIAAISAYAAPDGALLGPVELSRIPTAPRAHYGTEWVQYDVTGSGLVWFRRSDVNAVIAGPDLAPVAAQQQPQTGRGLAIDTSGGNDPNAWTPPEATPEAAPPAEPTATVVWPTVAPVEHRDDDFKQPDIRGTCQFVGCLGQQAADLSRAQACHALYWQYGNVEAETIPEPDYSAVRACIWEGLYQ